ncbi:MAG: hypothetical protein A3G80_06590 [Betaproteobacteria bacterium RIFCSPLOWO2_12_FULL_62_13b]|nr:MAG: hypothetical protein A3G80_06590 [Betaproteobacteria bacterium RIFCSPLOWO2_12_FULL_62_13b]
MACMPLRQFVFAVSLVASCHALAAGGPEPGMWELSADLAVPFAPGFKQEPVALRQCLTAADAGDPSRVLNGVANPGASHCRFTDKRESPGHTDFAVRCDGLFAISGRGSVDYTRSSIHGRLAIGFSAGAAGNIQRVESVSRVTGRRIGNC